jgi:hypothetical protein
MVAVLFVFYPYSIYDTGGGFWGDEGEADGGSIWNESGAGLCTRVKMARVGGWMGATLNRHTSGVGCLVIHPKYLTKKSNVGWVGVMSEKSRITLIVPIYWSFCPPPITNHQPRSPVKIRIKDTFN